MSKKIDSKHNKPLTKKRFERLLMRAAQPVSEWKHDREEIGTSAVHPSDGYSGKRKSQDKTEDKEDLPSD
jgi:hypothetical protein